jgi:hypothetical protein
MPRRDDWRRSSPQLRHGRSIVQRMMSKGDLSLSLFAIESSSGDRLGKMASEAGWGGPGKSLIEASLRNVFERRAQNRWAARCSSFAR